MANKKGKFTVFLDSLDYDIAYYFDISDIGYASVQNVRNKVSNYASARNLNMSSSYMKKSDMICVIKHSIG